MGGQVADIVAWHHRYALRIRTQDVLLQSVLFEVIWEKATNKEKEEVLTYIQEVNISELKRWIKKKELSVRKLRVLASNNHIKNYSRLSKIQLIEALKKKGIQ